MTNDFSKAGQLFEKIEKAVNRANDYTGRMGEMVSRTTQIIDALGPVITALFNRLRKLVNDPENLHRLNIQFLTKDNLVETAKKYMVANATGVAAKLDKDKRNYFVNLAYVNDQKELLPAKENNYVIITAEGVSREIEELFTNNDLVILK